MKFTVLFLLSFISALFLSFFQLQRSLSETKFYTNLFPLVTVLFRGFSKPSSKYMMNAFTVLQTNIVMVRKNAFCAIAQNAFFLLYYSDERFRACLFLSRFVSAQG